MSAEATVAPPVADEAEPARRRRSPIWTAVLVIIALGFAFPILWALLLSFKSTDSIVATRYPLDIWSFIPPDPTTENFGLLFGELAFGRNLLNTLIASAGQVVLAVITSTLAGYAVARLRFPGRDILFAAALATSFVPLEIILVPLYQVVNGMGLRSTYLALFLPFACQPFGIYLMRQAFLSLPVELDDAARVDGAGTFRIFRKIALPNVKPALATLVLIQFIWSWNAYLWPLVIMQDPKKQIAQVALSSMKSSPNFPLDGPLFAGVTVVTLPLVALAIWLQKYYVRGLMTSGIR